MKIYTYYQSVPELDAFCELKLITIWRRNWSAAGFEPIVLSEYHARQHPLFAEYHEAVSKFPSCNPQKYELSCWLRHLAMARLGGGVLMDYDVMVYPNDKEACRFLPKFRECQNFIMFESRAPCLNCGPGAIYEKLCREFMTGKWGNAPQGERSHVSDQYSLEQLVEAKADWIERRDDVKQFGAEGWEKALFVHYPNDALLRAEKTPKWKHIPTLRK